MNNYYFTEKISNKKVSIPKKEVEFPVEFQLDEEQKFVGFSFNDSVEDCDKRKLVLQIGKCLECRVKKNTPRSKKEKITEEPISKDQQPELPGPPVKEKKERKTKKVKEEVKEEKKEEKPFEEPVKLNLSNDPPRKQRARRVKKID
jgi:hypothetical protein